MNSRGGVKRDLCPEDLLTVAKNCLDLLMRPDKELRPGHANGSAAASRGWMNHRKEGREKKKKGKEREWREMSKVGPLWWRSCTAGWRHLLLKAEGL